MVMSAIEPKLKAQEAEIAKLANAKKAKKKSGVRTRARHPRPALGSQPRGAASHTRQGVRQIFRRGGSSTVVRKTLLWAHQKPQAGMGTERLVQPIAPDSQQTEKGRQ
jgi:hypothetical protein